MEKPIVLYEESVKIGALTGLKIMSDKEFQSLKTDTKYDREGINRVSRLLGEIKNYIYVVTAYSREEVIFHSYTLGAFTEKEIAIECAISHTIYVDGRYCCVVDQVELNHFSNEDEDYSIEVY